MDIKTFEKQWLSHFAADISAKNIRKYVVSTGNYIWHVFSWKLLPDGTYLAGDAAREAYNKVNKTDAIYIEPFGKGGSKNLTQNLENAADLDKLTEIYVAAKDFSWTYIKTHENDWCGPYFCVKSRLKHPKNH